jgi:fibronectin type 3 domain-containing protein
MVDKNNKSVNSKRIAINSYNQNSFTDTTVVEGKHYRYSIQCIGIDTTDTGSISAEAGIEIPEQLPVKPGSVSAYSSDKKIVIKWDIPSDNSITGFSIYRAIANNEATLLKQVSSGINQFEDSSVKGNQEYFYYIKSVNKQGKESNPTDEVSAKAQK